MIGNEEKSQKINGNQATPSEKVFSNIQAMGQNEIYDSKPYTYNNTNAIVACLILCFSTVAVFFIFLVLKVGILLVPGVFMRNFFVFIAKQLCNPMYINLEFNLHVFFVCEQVDD